MATMSKEKFPPHPKAQQKAKDSKKKAPQKSGTALPLWFLGGTIILTLIAYWPSLKNGFVNLDDYDYITVNSVIHSLGWENLKTMFTSVYFGNYHPLTTLTWAIDYAIDGEKQAWFFHAGNLVLHLANVILIFVFTRKLTGSGMAAAFIAVFTAIHPMHVESVAWVSERKDVLYSLFFLLSLTGYLRYQEKHQVKDYVLTIGMFLLAALSKSAAVVLPLLLLLIDFLHQRRFTARLFLEKVPFFLISVLFGVIAIRSQQAAIGKDVITGAAGVPQFLFATYGLLKYIFMFFIPAGMSAIHPYPATVSGTARILLYVSPTAVLILIGLVAWSLKYSRHIAFGFGFFIVNLLLVLQIVPVGEAYMAERYTYMAYFGLLYIVVHLAVILKERNKVTNLNNLYLALSVAAALVFTVVTSQRTQVWKNALSLYEDIAAKYPQKEYMVYYLKGLEKHDKGDLEGAVADYSEAARLHPSYSRPFNNRGNIYFYQGKYKEALDDFNQALSLDPGIFETWNNRGNAKAMLNDLPGALADYEKSLSLKPDYGDAFKNRGLVKMMKGDTASAAADWKIALQLGVKDAAPLLEQLGR